MDRNELNDWIEQRLARLDANTCEPNTDRAFARLQSRLRLSAARFSHNHRLGRSGGPSFSSGTNAATSLRASAPEAGKKLWLVGAALAAGACLCLLAFPTSRDAVQRLFATGANSKIVYVGQVYADLKTMKDKQPETDFTLKDAEGRDVTLSDLKGKVVLLNFWATWCEGCKTEIPWLIEFEQKYRDKGLAVIGVAEDADSWKSVGPYVKETKLNYTVVSDDDGSVANRYGLSGMPVTYLIDRDGKVSAASVGIVNKKECEAEILRLLGN
ncbi:MAG TPA: TlpA disulfide reductase family protein [Candidatus Acidoferrales bacterium]|nr:TlpA disulfide reductase family protein [Candidatus Acidoferrales bacterium]